MTTAILLILVSMFLLMLTLRIGYIWGRTMAEGIFKEYAHERPYMDCLELVDSMYPVKAETMKEVMDREKAKIWQQNWRKAGPRFN